MDLAIPLFTPPKSTSVLHLHSAPLLSSAPYSEREDMEITKFVVSGRDKALLYGDYMTYRAQLSNRIHNLRKKLAIATKPRAKYTSKVPITAEEIGSNHE